MRYFKQIDDLPLFDLKTELLKMLHDGVIDFNTQKQVCLNTTPDRLDDFRHGVGSLLVDWANAYTIKRDDGVDEEVVPDRPVPLQESDFSVLCERFHGTVFEEVYTLLKSRYDIGRVRLMKIPMRYCMSWHVDSTDRLHCPIITDRGCMMAIEDEVLHMPEGTWWMANTKGVHHTAFNAGHVERYHLVAVIQDENTNFWL
jgi:hypothetical protein